MAERFIHMQHLRFLLREVFAEEGKNIFSEKDMKSWDLVLNAAYDFAKTALHPLFSEMDKEVPHLENGKVHVHPAIGPLLRQMGKDGWISAGLPQDQGGDGLPAMLLHACTAIFASANYSASVYSALSMGAARLIATYGCEALRDFYLPPLLAGRWQGTMALTEAEAGSSLGDLACTAAPAGEGVYRIQGRKVFISAGDHDGVENVVHLMLARIAGAPPGVKGISLFVVPKLRPELGGLADNDITVTQIFHKMGYRGAPIAELSMGERNDCLGYLIGKENRGLAAMFQMMNGARLEVGMGAAAIATAAYQAALEYTKSRKQGRRMGASSKSEPVAIIEHADVKRMLLDQRAIAEGAMALVLQCGLYEDGLHTLKDEAARERHLLLDLLTPVAKSYAAEQGIFSVSQSLQCFGGYGYCEDFPVEQHFRDMRIHAIHEGTTGIQAMDLLGRKVMMENGLPLRLLGKEIRATLQRAGEDDSLAAMAKSLEEALQTLETTTATLGLWALEAGAEAFLADATLYLEAFGLVTVGWQWLKQALSAREKLGSAKGATASFYEGKISVCRYFFAYHLPKQAALCHRLMTKEALTLGIPTEYFT
jgi:butyryl-CoA dehydrogenase